MKSRDHPRPYLLVAFPSTCSTLPSSGETSPWIPRGCFQFGVAAASVGATGDERCETVTSSAHSATPRAERGIPTVPDTGLQLAPPPKLNGAGTQPPRLSRPSGRAESSAGPDPGAEGARRHLRRPSGKCAPRLGYRLSLPPCVLCPNPGALGTRGQAGHRAAARRLGALGAVAATARLRWNASPPASWKPLLALGLQPGLVPGAPAAAGGGSALGRRPLHRGPARPARPVRGCHPLPAPPPDPGGLGC